MLMKQPILASYVTVLGSGDVSLTVCPGTNQRDRSHPRRRRRRRRRRVAFDFVGKQTQRDILSI